MRKDTRLNLRITPDFKQQIERLAEYHGLTMSSYVHSLLVKAVRRESEETPDVFERRRGIKAATITVGTSKQKGQVVGRIEPGRKTAQRMIDSADISVKPKKRRTG